MLLFLYVFTCFFFFFNDTATTEIYTLSLHDALPIWLAVYDFAPVQALEQAAVQERHVRSEEHTSELQSRGHLVCRLLLEIKKNLLRRLRISLTDISCTIRTSESFRG